MPNCRIFLFIEFSEVWEPYSINADVMKLSEAEYCWNIRFLLLESVNANEVRESHIFRFSENTTENSTL
jgi:GH43 family beta-xylosidase